MKFAAEVATWTYELEAWGHQTRTAHDGAAALELAAKFQPEVALVDIGLPILDGFEVARRLRELIDSFTATY